MTSPSADRPSPLSVPPRFILESLVRADGSVDLGRAYALANSLGIPDQTLRLAIRRLCAENTFVQEGRGRRGLLRRTAAADLHEHHDVEFVQLAYAQDAGEAPWDRQWRLLALTVPERQRARRDRIRRVLRRLGAGQVHAGLYVSPHDWKAWLIAECPELAEGPGVVFASAGDLEIDGHTDPGTIAARIWDLAPVERSHRALRDLADATLSRADGQRPLDATAAALELAWVFDAAHLDDPLLPRELLPADWAGAAARASFEQAWSALGARHPHDGEKLFERFG